MRLLYHRVTGVDKGMCTRSWSEKLHAGYVLNHNRINLLLQRFFSLFFPCACFVIVCTASRAAQLADGSSFLQWPLHQQCVASGTCNWQALPHAAVAWLQRDVPGMLCNMPALQACLTACTLRCYLQCDPGLLKRTATCHRVT